MGAQRLSALADGVFAIAMTLLVLELSVPFVADEGEGLGELLLEMWPEFLMYALGFLVLGVYWIIHHMIFESIERYDTTLAWLNIVYLMFAALIPFVTALVVQNGATTATALAYGLNLLALFAMGWAMWAYATTRGRLVGDRVDAELARGASTMGLVYFVVLLVSLVLALFVPLVSMVVYAAIVIAFMGSTATGRWEAVTVWRRSLRRWRSWARTQRARPPASATSWSWVPGSLVLRPRRTLPAGCALPGSPTCSSGTARTCSTRACDRPRAPRPLS